MGAFIKFSIYILIICILIVILWYVKKRYPLSNIPFLAAVFFLRIPFIFIYINFLPGDWENYYKTAQLSFSDHYSPQLGTDSLYVFTRPLVLIGLSEIEIFFVYALIGYLGLTFFYLIGHKLTGHTDKVKVWGVNIFPWILLYPSVHIFSVMLGKDPLILFGLGMIGYSLIKNKIGKFYLVLGLLLLLIVRPHILFVVLASLVLALLWSKEWGGLKKSLLLSASLIASVILIPLALQFFRVSELSFEAIRLTIELNAGYGDDSSTFIDMSGYPLPLKMFTYLFRPLFIDAPNAMLLVYSLENLIFLLLTISILRVSFFQWITHQPRIIKFSLIFTILGTMVLSNGLSVFGLFMRQKTMVFLFLLLIIFAFIHDRNQKKIYRIKPANPDLPPSHA